MQGITWLEFWSGVILVAIPQIVSLIIKIRELRSQQPVVAAEAREKEATADEVIFKGWQNLAGEYARQVENMKALETENAQLRPLVLKIAIVQQENKQISEDKEDWKRYAYTLRKQLEDSNMVPLPFRRLPPDDTGEIKKMVYVPPDKEVKEISNDKTLVNKTVEPQPPTENQE